MTLAANSQHLFGPTGVHGEFRLDQLHALPGVGHYIDPKGRTAWLEGGELTGHALGDLEDRERFSARDVEDGEGGLSARSQKESHGGLPVRDHVVDVNEVAALGPRGVDHQSTLGGLAGEHLEDVRLRDTSIADDVGAVDIALAEDRGSGGTRRGEPDRQLLSDRLLPSILVGRSGRRVLPHREPFGSSDNSEAAGKRDRDPPLLAHRVQPARPIDVDAAGPHRVAGARHDSRDRPEMEDDVAVGEVAKRFRARKVPAGGRPALVLDTDGPAPVIDEPEVVPSRTEMGDEGTRDETGTTRDSDPDHRSGPSAPGDKWFGTPSALSVRLHEVRRQGSDATSVERLPSAGRVVF